MKPTTPKPPPALDDQGLPVGYRLKTEWEVTPRQVKAMLDRGDDFVLVDCRTPGEFDFARIEGAELLPLQQFTQAVEELEDERDQSIVVYCHHGQRSLRMTAALREVGFADVMSMAGGIDIWSLDVDTKVPRY